MKKYLLILCTLLMAAGCGGSSAPPTVTSTYPADGAFFVPIFVSPSIVFSKDMNPDTLSSSTITFVAETGDPVTFGVDYDPTSYEATITHSGNLAYFTNYTLTVSADVKDTSGNPLTEPYTFTFKTASQAAGTTSWMNPLPQGNEVRAVWSASATEIFAVGDNGSILFSDGSTWRLMQSGTYSDLAAVWGTSSSNVYAVGSDGVIMRYDGSSWLLDHVDIEGGRLFTVWGSSADDVYVSGQRGQILHWNGSDWRVQQSESISNITSMIGFASDEIYAVDWSSNVLKRDSTGWYRFKTFEDTNYMFNAIWGSSGRNLYVAGVPFSGSCQMFHYDGTSWDCVDDVYAKISSIWGTSATNIYAVGKGGAIYRYDGNSWRDEDYPYGIYFNGVSGSSVNDVYVVGDYGSLNHYDGSKWTLQSSTYVWDLSGIWGTAANNLFAVGNGGTILYYNGTSWEPLKTSPTVATFRDIDGANGNNIYAVTCGGTDEFYGEVVKYDGVNWQVKEDIDGDCLMDVLVLDADKVFAAGQSNVLRSADGGTTWTTDANVAPRREIRALSGSSNTNVFVVGDNGFVKRFNGTSWETLDAGTNETFSSVLALSPTEVYAGDLLGNIYLFDGTNWTVKGNPTGAAIVSLWGLSGEKLYIIAGRSSASTSGPQKVIFSYDGESFSQINNLSENWLNRVWGLLANQAYFVGMGGSILKYVE